jgi:prevent-host-death family protein
MGRVISQRELRNQSGEIMRAIDQGAEFIITRNGVPVAVLKPVRRRFVSRSALAAAMKGAPSIDARRFRDDVDAILDQEIEPRA